MICPRVGYCKISDGYCKISKPMAEVHTIGTKSWRNIGEPEWPHDQGMFDLHLNGFLHWIVYCQGCPYKICAFEVHNERFQHILPPLEYAVDNGRKITWMNVSAVGGRLCSCIRSTGSSAEVWMMKDYAFNGSWTRKFIIDVDIYARRGVAFSYQPVRFLENGDVWLICDSSLLILITQGEKLLKLLKFWAILIQALKQLLTFQALFALGMLLFGKDPLVRNNENDDDYNYNNDNTGDQGFHDSWHGASMFETFALYRCVYLGGKVGVSGFL